MPNKKQMRSPFRQNMMNPGVNMGINNQKAP